MLLVIPSSQHAHGRQVGDSSLFPGAIKTPDDQDILVSYFLQFETRDLKPGFGGESQGDCFPCNNVVFIIVPGKLGNAEIPLLIFYRCLRPSSSERRTGSEEQSQVFCIFIVPAEMISSMQQTGQVDQRRNWC